LKKEVAILEMLHPRDTTSLAELRYLTNRQNYQSVLPAALPEPMLLSIAKELRLVERLMKGDSAAEPSAVAAVALVLELLMRPKKGRARLEELELSDTAMSHALIVLQLALEREIVSRAVGIRADDEAEVFLSALDACI
jgi:hypothetical protein